MTTSSFARADDMPTATAAEHRLRIFAPTRRPRAVSAMKIETAHGEIKITGKLGQAHADLLDAICYCAEKKVDMEDGRIKLLVDPAAIRRTAGISSGEQFSKLVDELCAAVIEIRKPSPLACIGHLVDHIDTARRADGSAVTRRNPLTGGERDLWRVELGKAFCKLLGNDIWRGYDPTPIARLRHGISQAIARHVATHMHQPKGGWKLDTLIAAVAGEQGEQAMRDRRREVRAEAAELAALNLLVDGDRVHRVEQTPDSVEQTPNSVEQTPGAWSKRPALAVLLVPSGTSTSRLDAVPGQP